MNIQRLFNPHRQQRSRTFIICEIGINHNGDMKKAKKMIELASGMGVDAVKFQMRDLKDLYKNEVLENVERQDLSLQQSLDFVRQTQLSFDQFQELSDYARKKGITFLCTPWDKKSVDKLEKLNVPLYKVASADLENIPLIEKIFKTKKPLILSTGMSTIKQIDKTYNFLNNKNVNFALLHCNSTYPADFKDINMLFMEKMMERYDVPIGYSGHERGIAVTQAAVVLGAKIIERHFTLDKTLPGPDHAASLEPNELKQLVEGVRNIELALGSKEKRITQGIILNRETLGKSLISKQKIKEGQKITRDMVAVKSPGRGLSPFYLDQLVGKKAMRFIDEEAYFTLQDISDEKERLVFGDFQKEWGIPVRYHDLSQMWDNFNPDFVEIHLSYKDVIEPHFPKEVPTELKFKVHVPETWPDAFLLDLCSPDEGVRKKSLSYVDKSASSIKSFIEEHDLTQDSTDFILHVGGFSTNAPLSDSGDLKERYEYLKKSLTYLEERYPHLNFLPENMPPLPWLLGGQRFHNIFTRSDDIIRLVEQEETKICLDISHAALFCEYSTEDFEEYISKLLPYTDHLHLADAMGTDGEGLVIGQGNIDFDRVRKIINEINPNVSFITEIWQGHKFDGKGFYDSLNHLQQLGY